MWGYTVENWVRDPEDMDRVIGVNLTCDNGDTQYMTLAEYAIFTKNRDARKDCEEE